MTPLFRAVKKKTYSVPKTPKCAIVLGLILKIAFFSHETAYCAANGGNMPWCLGENSLDDIETDFERMREAVTMMKPEQQGYRPIGYSISLPLRELLGDCHYTGGRPVSYKLHELLSITPMPGLNRGAESGMSDVYIDIIRKSLEERGRLIHLSRYCVGNCTIRLDANTIVFDGPRFRGLRVMETLPEGETEIPNAHTLDPSNGYSLDRYTVRIRRTR